MVRGMYRIACVLCALVAGCGSEETCGTLTMSLAENAAAYPTDVALSCDIEKGGVRSESVV